MITVKLIGTDTLTAKLGKMQTGATSIVERVITKFAIDLQRHVMEDKLSGQVLNRRTGTLRRSITYDVTRSGDSVVGVVGTNVKYGRVHEYGGTITVKEHMRMVKQVFGRKLKEPVQATVRAHTASYPERSFLRSALRDMAPELVERLEAAMGKLNDNA